MEEDVRRRRHWLFLRRGRMCLLKWMQALHADLRPLRWLRDAQLVRVEARQLRLCWWPRSRCGARARRQRLLYLRSHRGRRVGELIRTCKRRRLLCLRWQLLSRLYRHGPSGLLDGLLGGVRVRLGPCDHATVSSQVGRRLRWERGLLVLVLLLLLLHLLLLLLLLEADLSHVMLRPFQARGGQVAASHAGEDHRYHVGWHTPLK